MDIQIKNTMKVIKADDNMVMTNWNEGDNILDFSYCRMIYAPLNSNTDGYREITKEEAEELIKRQQEEYEKMEASRMK